MNIENFVLFNCEVFNFLQREQQIDYQLIFIDPPYKNSCLSNVLNALFQGNFIKNNKYIYFEQDKKNKDQSVYEYINAKYDVIKDLSIGDVSYTIAQKRS